MQNSPASLNRFYTAAIEKLATQERSKEANLAASFTDTSAAPNMLAQPNVYKNPMAAMGNKWNPRAGTLMGLTGAAQGLYHLNDADSLGEGLGQAAADTLPGAVMYGLTRPGVTSGVNTLAQKATPKAPLRRAAAQTAGAVAKKGLGAAAKFVGKRLVPGVGLAAAIPGIKSRLGSGDYLGAAGEALSGGLGLIPGIGTMASAGVDALMAGRDIYKERNPELPKGLPNSTPTLPATQPTIPQGTGSQIKPDLTNTTKQPPQIKMSAETQFQKNLADPQAGLNSDLYSAVAPMVSSGLPSKPTGIDAARINNLKEQMRKGLVGLEYLTGLKRNTGETFYDEHPAEAVATDVLGKSPLIGAGVAAGGVGLNFLRQARNMHMTQPSAMSREGNSLDPSNSSNLLDPARGNLRADVSRVFGDDENAAARLKILDRLNKSAPGKGFTKDYERLAKAKAVIEAKHGKTLDQLNQQLESPSISEKDVKRVQARINAIEKAQAHQTASIDKNIKALLTKAKSSRGASALPGYANFHESLQRANQQGGLKGYVGEGLHDYLGDGEISSWIKKNILPGRDQAIGDLLEKHKLTGQNPHFDDMLIKDIIRENKGGAPLHPDFNETTLRHIADPEHQSSGLRRSLRKMKLPLAAGAGIAAGGTGLYYLLKAIQNQMHPKDKTDEWKRTLLKARGDFEGANRIG